MRRVTCNPWQDDPKFVAQLEAHMSEFQRYFEDPATNKRPEIREKWYKRFRVYLLQQFFKKCAYCEIKLVGQGHGDVEHFRPKNAVQDAQGKPVFTATGRPHPGYWWLAYTWGNLLPACSDCNATQQKGNRFPVSGKYAEGPKEFDDALLVNPLLDDPEKHIRWNIATGMPVGIDAKGKTTIKILRFRQREELNDLRKDQQAKAEDAVAKIMSRKCNEKDLKKARAFVNSVKKGSAPFSAYALAAISKAKAEQLANACELP